MVDDFPGTNVRHFKRHDARHDLPGYYALADLPTRPSIEKIAIDTGWWELDRIWKLYPGQFTVITGIAGHGKSTFVLNVLCNLAKKHGTRSFLFVPENEQHLRDKMRKIHGGTDGEFSELAKNYIFVQSAVLGNYNDDPVTLAWVLSQAAQVIEDDNLDVLLIDPWNELEHAKRKDQSTTEYIGESLMMLKNFARSHSVAIILVAHPTKATFHDGKPRVPNLADIEGSMNWYNKADNGLVVWRDFGNNSAEVISSKVREVGAGKIGKCVFHVDENTSVFTPQYGAAT